MIFSFLEKDLENFSRKHLEVVLTSSRYEQSDLVNEGKVFSPANHH